MAKYKITVFNELGFTTGSYKFTSFETDDFEYIDAIQLSFRPIRPNGEYIKSWPENIIVPIEKCSIFRME